MPSVFDTTAIGVKKGKEAATILEGYAATNPTMALNRAVEVEKQPKGTGAGDKLVDPGR